MVVLLSEGFVRQFGCFAGTTNDPRRDRQAGGIFFDSASRCRR
jgi:hypothetical protein